MWVLDNRFGDYRRFGRGVGEHVDTAVWEARFLEDLADGPIAPWRQLGAFEDGGVAGGKGVDAGAEAKDVRRVPTIQALVKIRGRGRGGVTRARCRTQRHMAP